MIKNRLNIMLDIEYPIIQDGIDYVSGCRLAAAVSEAGGLGIIPCTVSDLDSFQNEIKKIKEITGKAFGVKFPLDVGNLEEIIEILLEEEVQVVITYNGAPGSNTRRLKEKNCRILHEVSNIEEARLAESMGVDAVIARGIECSGYSGKDEITTMVLTPMASDAVKIPVITAGGIVDGRTFSAALSLGAEGVLMGTRFVLTWESTGHEKYKEALIKSSNSDTILVMRKDKPLRLLKNKFSLRLKEMEDNNVPIEEMKKELTFEKFYKGMKEGDIEEGALLASQAVGIIKSLRYAKDVIKETMFDFIAIGE